MKKILFVLIVVGGMLIMFPGAKISLADGPLVSDLTVASSNSYEVLEGGFTAGADVYTDRDYIFTDVLTGLEGATYIKGANNDKFETSENFLSFTALTSVNVFVAYDVRATSLPNWLSDWMDTGQTIGTNDVDHQLYVKNFPAGVVSLGANFAPDASGAGSNYIVIVKERPAPSNQEDPVLSIADDEIEVGSSKSFPVVLSHAPNGLSGYQLDLSLSDPSVARFNGVTFPMFDMTTFDLQSDSELSLVAVDLRRELESGAQNTTLALVEIEAVGPGTAQVDIGITLLQDDSGFNVPAQTDSGAINTFGDSSGSIESTLTVASGQLYEVVPDGLGSGVKAYIDRNYTVENVPSYLSGSTYVKTANDDKQEVTSPFISFDVSQSVDVYIAYDDRLQVPDWASSFADTGDDVVIAGRPHSILVKGFGSGTVELGANEGVGFSSMYVVIVQ